MQKDNLVAQSHAMMSHGFNRPAQAAQQFMHVPNGFDQQSTQNQADWP